MSQGDRSEIAPRPSGASMAPAHHLRENFEAWGKETSLEQYLLSPGEGKEWKPTTKVAGKVKNAVARSFNECWQQCLPGVVIPDGLLGRMGKATTPFIRKDDVNSNQVIVQASARSVYLAALYIEEFKRHAVDGADPAGKTVTAATVSAYQLLCEGKTWKQVQAAMLESARRGFLRVDLVYNQLVSRSLHGDGALDRLAAAQAWRREAENASASAEGREDDVPEWQRMLQQLNGVPAPVAPVQDDSSANVIEGEVL